MFIFQLLEHIRFPLMQKDFFMNCVEPESLVREDSNCKEYILEAMKYHLLPERRGSLVSTRTKERNPDGACPYVFAIGKTLDNGLIKRNFKLIFDFFDVSV